MWIRLSILVALILCPTFGCNRDTKTRDVEVPSVTDDEGKALMLSVSPAGRADIPAVVSGNTEFGVRLYTYLRRSDVEKNLVFSPFGVSTVTAMTLAGASGRTKSQTETALFLSLDAPRSIQGYAALLSELAECGRPEKPPPTGRIDPSAYYPRLRMADAVWIDRRYPIDASFSRILNGSFGAPVKRLDLSDHPKAAAEINAWVAAKTFGKIPHVISADALPESCRLLLANTVYFRGTWMEKFYVEGTVPSPFHVSGTHIADVPTMRKTDAASSYAEAEGVQILERPYFPGRLSMVIVLPRARNGLPEVESKITSSVLKGWIQKLKPQAEVIVFLPRFKAETTIDLRDALQSLGMADAFTPGRADYGEITGSKNDLYLARDLHAATISVDEDGTEATAFTGIISSDSFDDKTPPPPPEFIADHPFLFLIRDRKTGTILFMGRVNDPRG